MWFASIQRNLVDLIYVEKTNIKGRYFYSLNEQITGEKIYSKINKLFKILNKKKIDNIFISAPENVAWLLNLRGKDNPNSPMPNCRLILSKEKKSLHELIANFPQTFSTPETRIDVNEERKFIITARQRKKIPKKRSTL